MYNIAYINNRGKRDGSGVGTYRQNLLSKMKKQSDYYNIKLHEITTSSKIDKIIKSFIMSNNYDLIHFEPDYPLYIGAWLRNIPCLKLSKTKLIVTLHGITPLTFPNLSYKRQIIRSKLLKILKSTIDGIFTVSESEKKFIIQHFEINEQNVIVTYNGNNMLELDYQSIDSHNEKPHSKDYILHVSNGPSWRKNPKLLLKSFKMFSQKKQNFDLIIIGSGWDISFIKDIIKYYNVRNKVHLIDHIKQQELIKYYKNASIYLQTSVWESFCMPVIEAMTFGIPVVCTHAYALGEIAKNGAIYVNEDPIEVSDTLINVIDDNELYEAKSKQAIEIAKKYNWSKTANKTLEAYVNILNS